MLLCSHFPPRRVSHDRGLFSIAFHLALTVLFVWSTVIVIPQLISSPWFPYH